MPCHHRHSNRSEPWIVDRSDAFAWQFRVSESENKEEAEEYFDQVGAFLTRNWGRLGEAPPRTYVSFSCLMFRQKWPVYMVRAKRGYNSRPARPIPKVRMT
jgi:hypothetical protein